MLLNSLAILEELAKEASTLELNDDAVVAVEDFGCAMNAFACFAGTGSR